MATLLSILTDAALYLNKTYSDLTISGENLGLVAVNHAKRRAGLLHDFEFNRKLVEIAVDGATGGSLASALLHSDGTTAVEIKSVLEVGVFDTDNNLRPVTWTTVAESLERQRKDNRGESGWWGARDDRRASPVGGARFEFTGTSVFLWPKDVATSNDYTLGAEVYAMDADWTAADLTGYATVAGSVTTAINGTYTMQGFYNSRPLFLNITEGYALWSTGTEWRIALIVSLGGSPTSYYSLASTSASPAGTYTNHTLTGTVTVADGTSTTDIWVRYASEYLMWFVVEQLNTRFKWLVQRTEGNLPPPSAMTAAALDSFIQWDANMYEQFRRHSR